mgnify:CR=1 FL=1
MNLALWAVVLALGTACGQNPSRPPSHVEAGPDAPADPADVSDDPETPEDLAPDGSCSAPEPRQYCVGCWYFDWECIDGRWTCNAPPPLPEPNECGGLCPLPDLELWSPCGPCGRDVWLCDADGNGVHCSSFPENQPNACGGCEQLDDELVGEPCGACNSGVWACAGPNELTCVGDLGEQVWRNVCGGCTPVVHTPGVPCYKGCGVYDCIDPEQVSCVPTGDCQQTVVDVRSAAETVIVGYEGHYIAGAWSGDLNGDGQPDLVTGSRGFPATIYVLFGPLEAGEIRPWERADAAFYFQYGPTAVADFNGDGVDDLLIRDSGQFPGSVAYIYFGPIPPGRHCIGFDPHDQSDFCVRLEPDIHIVGDPEDLQALAVRGGFDARADGYADLAVALRWARPPRVHYFHQLPLGTVNVDQADAVVVEDNVPAYQAAALGTQTVTLSGYPAQTPLVAMAAPTANHTYGGVYLFDVATLSGRRHVSSADYELWSVMATRELGSRMLSGRFDDRPGDDLFVAPYAPTFYSGSGRSTDVAWLVNGPVTRSVGDLDVSADTRFTNLTPTDTTPAPYWSAGDLNEDGYDELLAALPRPSFRGHIFRGPTPTGFHSLDLAQAVLSLPEGVSSMQVIDSVTGDGDPDLAVNQARDETETGRVYILGHVAGLER